MSTTQALRKLSEKFATAAQELEAGNYEPYDILQLLDSIRYSINDAQASAAADMRRNGATWQDIGDALQVTRQAAHERFADTERYTAEGETE